MQLLHLLPSPLDVIPEHPGPVDQVQVDVVHAELFERLLARLLGRLVPGAPLGGDPDFGAGQAGLFECLADFFFVVVA